jgi:heterodisulfide reductase subunit B
MCEYNLGTRQGVVVAATDGLSQVPTYYFTQLLVVALGLDPELCRLDLNGPVAQELLVDKKFIAAATV